MAFGVWLLLLANNQEPTANSLALFVYTRRPLWQNPRQKKSLLTEFS